MVKEEENVFPITSRSRHGPAVFLTVMTLMGFLLNILWCVL